MAKNRRFIQDELSEYFKDDQVQIVQIKGDGSKREYFRVSVKNNDFIACYSNNTKQNEAFFFLSRLFLKNQIIAPEILYVNQKKNCYLLSDFGEHTLASILAKLRINAADKINSYYLKAVKILIKTHQIKEPSLTFFQNKYYDIEVIRQDTHYFITSFIKTLSADELLTESVHNSLKHLEYQLAQLPQTGIILKDFQSRNIMYNNGNLALIDFQDAQIGSIYYDLASLLYASCAYLNETERTKLLEEIHELDFFQGTSQHEFYTNFYQFALLRRIRSFGTYGNLGIEKKKISFFQAISPAFENIIILLQNQYLQEYHPLYQFFVELSLLWNRVKKNFSITAI